MCKSYKDLRVLFGTRTSAAAVLIGRLEMVVNGTVGAFGSGCKFWKARLSSLAGGQSYGTVSIINLASSLL